MERLERLNLVEGEFEVVHNAPEGIAYVSWYVDSYQVFWGLGAESTNYRYGSFAVNQVNLRTGVTSVVYKGTAGSNIYHMPAVPNRLLLSFLNEGVVWDKSTIPNYCVLDVVEEVCRPVAHDVISRVLWHNTGSTYWINENEFVKDTRKWSLAEGNQIGNDPFAERNLITKVYAPLYERGEMAVIASTENEDIHSGGLYLLNVYEMSISHRIASVNINGSPTLSPSIDNRNILYDPGNGETWFINLETKDIYPASSPSSFSWIPNSRTLIGTIPQQEESWAVILVDTPRNISITVTEVNQPLEFQAIANP